VPVAYFARAIPAYSAGPRYLSWRSGVDRKVESILAEWRQLEREHDAATDDEMREALEALIAERAEEHGVAVDKLLDEGPPTSARWAAGA